MRKALNIMQGTEQWPKDEKKERRKYGTIVIDHATGWNEKQNEERKKKKKKFFMLFFTPTWTLKPYKSPSNSCSTAYTEY